MNEIDKKDKKFQILVNLISKKLEQIKKEFKSEQLVFLKNAIVLVEQDTSQNLNFSDGDKEIIELLNYFVHLTKEEEKIRFSLDSIYILLHIGGLYNSLMEKLIPFYLLDPPSISEKLLLLLNEVNFHYNKKIIPYEILIPLKGISFKRRKSEKIPDLVFISEESEFKTLYSNRIEINVLKDMRIIRKDGSLIGIGTELHDSQKDTVSHAISLLAKSYISFELQPPEQFPPPIELFFPKKFLNLKNNPLWIELKNIYASFLIYNQKIRFGKPFYSFPWWLSKKISRYFEFPNPPWMLKTNFPKQHRLIPSKIFEELIIADVIPDFDRFNTFIFSFKKHTPTIKSNIWISEMGFGGSGRDPKGDFGFQRMELIFPPVKQNYIFLSDENNSINFKKESLIFDRLIRLRQREYVEDAIIDANLIIESLLIPSREELGFRFRLNATLLVADSLKNAPVLFDYFKTLYDLRSSIVHGKNWNKKYREFAKKILPYSIANMSGDELILKTQQAVIDSIFVKICKLLIRIIKIKEKFPKYLDSVENLLKLVKEIKDE